MSDTRRHRNARTWRDRGRLLTRPLRLDLRCREKRRFVTEIEARATGMVTIAERGNVGRLWCYRCPHCAGWHLTSKNSGRPAITAENAVATHAPRP